MTEQYKYTVCIHCMTYNHKPYILDALHGFTMQQTDFPYVAIVMDDASTDGEPEVLRQYIAEQCDAASLTTKDDELYELVEINAKDNPNCHFAFYFLKENQYRTGKKRPIIVEWDAQAKYIALCEGDDYWTDPYKLQKQVDYMEKHEECSLCFTNVKVKSPNAKDAQMYQHLENREYSAAEVYERWTIPTCLVLYRYDMWKRMRLLPNKVPIVFGDIVLFLRMAEQGNLYCLNFKSGVYRRHEGGVSVENSYDSVVRVLRQYRWMRKYFKKPDLLAITKRNINQYIGIIANMPSNYNVLGYRILHMVHHPRLIFSSYFSTTLLSYSFFKYRKKQCFAHPS